MPTSGSTRTSLAVACIGGDDIAVSGDAYIYSTALDARFSGVLLSRSPLTCRSSGIRQSRNANGVTRFNVSKAATWLVSSYQCHPPDSARRGRHPRHDAGP